MLYACKMRVAIFTLLSCVILVEANVLKERTTYTYPQPALPAATARTDKSMFMLSNDWNITDVPETREYYFNISKATGNPDGYKRQVFLVNGQFPGPLVEANEGDSLVIHVTNSLDDGQSIHWHGMYQNGTNQMDGITGVSQCPIPPGGTYTYRFTVSGQYGTFFWHSHYGNTMTDGIFGPLIIHSVRDPNKRGVDYDEERLLVLMDWMHDQSSVVVDALMSTDGYRGTVAAPQGDSILVNGVGQANCSAVPRDSYCKPPSLPEILVVPGKRYRFRILNTGAHSMLRPSIDNHDLKVIEADSTPVDGPTIHELPISPAQRYSVIVETNQGDVGSKFWMRIGVASACMRSVHQEGLAVFRYVSDVMSTDVATDYPSTKAWSDCVAWDSACLDLDMTYDLTPREAIDAVGEPLVTHVLSSTFGAFVTSYGQSFLGFGVNGVAFRDFIYDPLLSVVQSGYKLNDTNVASKYIYGIGPTHIIINNFDNDELDHPYHLHGQDFQIIARGTGNMTAEKFSTMDWKTNNPLRRDTVWVRGSSWVAIRFTSDNPGVWALHCHISFHLSVGKLAALVVQPDKIRQFDYSSEWTDMCTGDPNYQGPDRRSLPPTSPASGPKLGKSRMLRSSG